jgi:hypothetical protein
MIFEHFFYFLDNDAGNASDKNDDEDDFLDEFGNIKESNTSEVFSEPEDFNVNGKGGKNKKRKKGKKANKSSQQQQQQKQEQHEQPSKVESSSPKKFERQQFNPKTCWKDYDNMRDEEISTPSRPEKGQLQPVFKQVDHAEPRDSNLTHGEQKCYLRLLTKFRNSQQYTSHSDVDEFNLFQNYRELVLPEQAEYQKFAKAANATRNINQYLPPG